MFNGKPLNAASLLLLAGACLLCCLVTLAQSAQVYRAANEKPLLFPDDADVVGIATDTAVETTLATAHLDDIEAVAAMLLRSAISVDDLLVSSKVEG